MRSVISLILVYCLAITSVFAQSVNPNDTLKIGKASSSSDKGLTFDTNDGVSNKKLLIEKISKKLKFDGNTFQIGDGSSSSDKELIIAGALKSLKYNGTSGEFEFNDDVKLSGTLKADFLQAVNTEVAINSLLRASQGIKVGAGANEIRVNAGNLEFSNDGVLYKKFGTGTGGGSTGVNLLSNDSFEDGITTGWTSSGGTFSQQTYAIGVEGDTKYARFIAAGVGEYVEQIVSVPSNFSAGCQADFKKVNVSTAGLFKIQALDVSNNVLAEQTIGVSAWIKVPTITFPCPASGTNNLKLRLISLAAGTIEFDRGYVGSNQNLVSVGLSNIGDIVTTSASSCPASTINADGSALSRSTYSQLFAKIGVSHGQGDGSTTFNLPDYRGRFLRGVAGGSANDPDRASRTAMNTGGNTGDNVGSVQDSAFGSHSHIESIVDTGGGSSYGTASVPNQRMGFWSSTALSTTASITSTTGGNETRPKNAYVNYCIKFQEISSDTAVSNEQSSWFIDANIGGANPVLGIGAQTSYTPLGHASLDLVVNSNKGSANAEIPCASGVASSGFTCSGASEIVGIAFTPLSSGAVEACFDFGISVNDANGVSFQLVETSNTGSTIIQEGGSRMTASGASTTTQMQVCGSFNFSDVSKRTIKLMYEKVATTGDPSIGADRLATLGQRDIHITVRPLLSAYNRPVLTGDQVTTPTGRKNIHTKARVSASGVVTYLGSDTPWISSNQCTISSTSLFSCNYVAGIFDGVNIPICHASVNSTAGTGTELRNELVSSLTVETFTTSSGAAVARGFNISCDGISPN